MRLTFAAVLALLVCLAPAPARAEEPPGTPKPSTGAPGDKAGRSDPFGSQGEKAEEKPSQAEQAVKARKPVIEAIDIEGNKHTRTGEIRRHLTPHEGDELDDDAVMTSRI